MSFVRVEHPRPKITLVTLNRPERMNAMAFDVMVPLRDTLREISLDNECRVVVITGAGHGFCSGADLVGSGMLPNIEGLQRTSIARRAMKVLDDVILGIRDMHQPVIAAVNGAAIGGGFCLASACDIRIASETAKFGQPELGLGIIPAAGGTQRLPRVVGMGWAKHLVLTGEIIDAKQALAIGLVTSIAPAGQLTVRARELAKKALRQGPLAARLAKLALNAASRVDLDSGLLIETLAQAICYASDDKTEGTAAFLEKRKPKFTGR
jgi:enoyl-CoA hydratase